MLRPIIIANILLVDSGFVECGEYVTIHCSALMKRFHYRRHQCRSKGNAIESVLSDCLLICPFAGAQDKANCDWIGTEYRPIIS